MLNITGGFYQAKDNFSISGKYLDFFSQMIFMGIYRLMEIKYRVSKRELVTGQSRAGCQEPDALRCCLAPCVSSSSPFTPEKHGGLGRNEVMPESHSP